MFECEAIKWDRKFIFGLKWPPMDSSVNLKPLFKTAANLQTYKNVQNRPATGATKGPDNAAFKGQTDIPYLPATGAATASNFVRPRHGALNGPKSKKTNL